MALDSLLHHWRGVALRHIPSGSSRGVLDDTYAGFSKLNRWNEAGTPTFYFACDIAVVLAEYGRHIDEELPGGEPERLSRAVWKVPIALDRVIDLRDPAAVDAIGLPPLNDWIGDRDRTQATVRFLRHHVDVQGLLVPSMGFLDDHRKWNVVVYLDRIDPRVTFSTPEFVRHMVLEAIGGELENDSFS